MNAKIMVVNGNMTIPVNLKNSSTKKKKTDKKNVQEKQITIGMKVIVLAKNVFGKEMTKL